MLNTLVCVCLNSYSEDVMLNTLVCVCLNS